METTQKARSLTSCMPLLTSPRNRRTLVKNRLIFLALIAASLVVVPAFAGSEPQGNLVNRGFELFGGAAFAVGDFNDIKGDGAKTGYLAGARFTIPLGDGSGFLGDAGISLGVTVSVNPFDVSALEQIPGLVVTSKPWVQIWPMIGLKETFQLSPLISQDFNLCVGAVITKGPKIDVAYSGSLLRTSFESHLTSGTGVAVAYQVSTNFVFDRSFLIGGGIMGGRPTFDATITSTGINASGTTKHEAAVTIPFLTVGYRF